MWNANVSITNNTDYNVTINNNFILQETLPPYGGSLTWDSSDSPNVSSLRFWKTDLENVDFQSGLNFGYDCGVWADRGFMDTPNVIMDINVNGTSVSQELNGGQTIVEDFSSGGYISLVFRNKVFTQEFRLG